MARINLLPWRAERRKQRQNEFYMMLGGAAALALLLAFGIVKYFDAEIAGQTNRNAFLEQQITALDAQIKEIEELERTEARLLARKQVIEQLQANRSQMVHLFDELVRTIPEGVKLTSIKQNGVMLTLDGVTQSNARVSSYMRNLESSGWMKNPELSIIEAKGGDRSMPYQFTLTVTMTKPGGEPMQGEEDDTVAMAGGTP